MALLEIDQDVRDGGVVVSASGDIDSSTVDTLISHLDAALETAGAHPARVLVLELSRVTYFGSAGLNAVLGCHEKGRSGGISVRVVACSAEVTLPIEVTRLDSVLRPHQTVADALDESAEP